MKKLLFILLTSAAHFAQSQGTFVPHNPVAHTRIGTTYGPLAGAGIWGQFLVGLTSDSLTPVGVPLQHGGLGSVNGPEVTVPFIPGGIFAYIQLVAWNGTLWGTSLSGVPQDQLGRTDIILHPFTQFPQTSVAPLFTQGAVVPAVPEPSAVALAVVGAGVLWCATRARRRKFL